MKNQPINLRHTFTAALLLLAAATAHAAPPTVDPTYGLPIPKRVAPVAVEVRAKWIWVAKTDDTQTVSARAVVLLKAAPRKADLFVTGDDAFTLFVNGKPVTLSRSVEQGWKQVLREPVGALLHRGRNVVALQGTNSGGAAGLLAQLDIDGKTALRTDHRWKVLESPAPPAEWTGESFDDSGWTGATELAPVGEGPWGNALNGWPDGGGSAWYLSHLTLRPTAVEALSGHFGGTMSAVRPSGPVNVVVPAAKDGEAPASLLVDFGREVAGRIVLEGTAGAVVRVTTGEVRAECFHAEPALDNHGPTNLTLSAGNSAVTSYSAFRYALLVFPSKQAAALTRIECDHKYYPVAYKGSFSCSDPLLTRIWYAGAYTAHLCMQEDIWDAPKRDRGLWCGDLHVTGSTINDVFGDTFLMEHSIDGLRRIAQGGRPASALPSRDINSLPGYTSAWFCELADYYRHRGGDAFLKSQHQAILTLLEYQKTEFDANHLFVNPLKRWNFVDWAPNFVVDSPKGRQATDLFDIAGVHEAVYLLRTLGDTTNADKYADWARTLTRAARETFLDPTAMTYGDRLQTNVMAVYSGVATPPQRAAIYSRILQASSPVWTPPTAQPNLDCFTMTPYYGYYVLRDLGDLGKQQAGVDLIRRYWGDMMRRGATTLLEKFDPALPNDDQAILDKMPYLSYCHGWSTGPTSYLSEYVLGVVPTSGGMKTVRITPFLGDLNWIEGDVPTPGGIIHVRADREGGRQTDRVTLPAGVDAEIGVVGGSVTLNGRPAPVARRENGISYVRVARAGVYRLTGKP